MTKSKKLNVFLLLCSNAILAGCGSGGGDICKCLQEYSDEVEVLSEDDIRKLDDRVKDCFDGFTNIEVINEIVDCMPIRLGIDSRTNLEIWITWGCMDPCPHDLYIYVEYSDIGNEERCNDVGGTVLGGITTTSRSIICIPPGIEGVYLSPTLTAFSH